MSTQKDLEQLFGNQGKTMGLDDEASSSLIANLNATVAPMCMGDPFDDDELETDDFRLVGFAIDASGSMEDVADDVRETFNEVVIPGLLGGAAPVVGAIRYFGLRFGSDVTPLWGGGWKKLTDELPKLTTSDYFISGATALHKGTLDLVTAAVGQALQIQQKTGTPPEVTLAVISDGANNQRPMNPDDVKRVLDPLSRELFTLAFFGFETFERVNFMDIAKAMGFRDIQDSRAKPGETRDDQRRRFRHAMKVFSERLVANVSVSKVGQPVSQTGGFWTNP